MLSFFSPVPRNKSDPPDHPILSSLSILFCYHQGTVVKGSLLITAVRIPRAVLMYMCNTLKEKVRQHVKTECAVFGSQRSESLENCPGSRDGNVTCARGHSESSGVLQVPSAPRPQQPSCPAPCFV